MKHDTNTVADADEDVFIDGNSVETKALEIYLPWYLKPAVIFSLYWSKYFVSIDQRINIFVHKMFSYFRM